MIQDVERWRADLMFCGNLIQDEDDRDALNPADEARRTGHEYAHLLDLVEGDEPDTVFQTLIDSMQVDEDYEVYQGTLGAAFAFGARMGPLLLRALQAGWLERDPERAGDWLGQLAYLGRKDPAVTGFNDAWAEAETAFSESLLAFVTTEEDDGGWLCSPEQIGVLRPSPATTT